MSKARLIRDIKELEKSNEFDVIKTDDIRKFYVIFDGLDDSNFSGGTFKLQIETPIDYPYKPLDVMFKNRMYHPNISEDGFICLDILKQNWSPALSLYKVFLSIITLMSDPNPNDPLNPVAARLYENNIEEYNEMVKIYTKQYAI